jgi:hypothetical protein
LQEIFSKAHDLIIFIYILSFILDIFCAPHWGQDHKIAICFKSVNWQAKPCFEILSSIYRFEFLDMSKNKENYNGARKGPMWNKKSIRQA